MMSDFQKQRNAGFTLVETLAVIVIVGVMAAIAAPGMLGFLARSKVDRGFSDLQNMVYTTQREAMKRSRNCEITLPENESENTVLTSDCLITGPETLANVFIKYNYANRQKIKFDYRGGTSPLRTIAIYSPNTNYRRCLVISNGIGMTRSGIYTKETASAISATYCQTTR
ncbi:MAG: type II secretion system protein [Limnothrix sp. RL_2_0]|nr:type II secretion system protein [Limnothrix sp. RL_2_0]